MTGFALSSLLATNVSSMIALYGFMAGSGLGLMYVPTIISVNYYFDKKRSIANGEEYNNTESLLLKGHGKDL